MADGSAGVPSGGRKRKLTPAQLAHKRELDRRAQRTNREKTKNRITHLENLVESLQGSDKDRTTTLIQQIDQQKTEVERLQGLLSAVAKLVGGSTTSTGDNAAKPDSRSSTVWMSPKEPTPVKLEADDEFVNGGGLPTDTSTASPNTTDSDGSQTRVAPAKSLHIQQASRKSITQMASDISSNTGLDGRMWYIAGVLLRHILATVHPSQINYEHDDDIAIRAVFEGWSSVSEKYPLDKGWQWLKEVDERIYFHRCEPFRLMHLRNCRLVFLRQMFRNSEWGSRVPSFFAPRPAEENMEHDPLIEYFPWPGLRERMVFSPTTFATDKFMNNLRCEIEFTWSDNPHELYDWDPMTEKYSYSNMYYDRIVDLRCYPGTVDFFESFPELKRDIPQATNALTTLRIAPTCDDQQKGSKPKRPKTDQHVDATRPRLSSCTTTNSRPSVVSEAEEPLYATLCLDFFTPKSVSSSTSVMKSQYEDTQFEKEGNLT
ncbi:uncharacterized protein HMPREF1541_09612 [Cyphellophora europaea CBS 101466]|uniref:BZIP domain-containing protein n=1 Tax=Cyphellophora europaea (strain CBS 101466) TaxID=1220924 RepID=W2SCX7_CYPE1|nr:uncharacterized protein HMPREF1541_09612 [Cyphellophora europaea CBS 101466]ETN45779.1 hypothetical protein HMPREF1541_09612 [Cyphellophora europaea CBS 101466]